MAGVAASSRQRSKIAPYLMILPALAYLAIFFVVPFVTPAASTICCTLVVATRSPTRARSTPTTPCGWPTSPSSATAPCPRAWPMRR